MSLLILNESRPSPQGTFETPGRVLLVHNYYRERGGEDYVFESEAELLEAHGWHVERFTVHNDETTRMSGWELARTTVWNQDAYRELRKRVAALRPQVVHFHNTFPLISPSAYFAARHEGAAVVQTLHNYRVLCPNAQFQRNGSPCEQCLEKAFPWPGVRHACYRDSRTASSVVAVMIGAHRVRGTWSRHVDTYIALTDFARRKFVQGGIPSERIVIKPNFVLPDLGPGEGKGDFALFVGRLSSEKGIRVLLEAWGSESVATRLVVVGTGPLEHVVREAAQSNSKIEARGELPRSEVLRLMRDACALVFPSLWYEGAPMTITEAFSAALPVVASDLGAMRSLVRNGENGFRFRTGDARALLESLDAVRADSTGALRRNARTTFEREHQADHNYRLLTRAYENAHAIAMGKTSPIRSASRETHAGSSSS